jgi:hypothetical protein
MGWGGGRAEVNSGLRPSLASRTEQRTLTAEWEAYDGLSRLPRCRVNVVDVEDGGPTLGDSPD